MLPALTAALIGVVAAGSATLMSNLADSDADSASVTLSAADAEKAQPRLDRPEKQMGTNVPAPSDRDETGVDGTSDEPPAATDAKPATPSGSSKRTSSEETVPTTTVPPQDATEDEVVALVNKERAKAGCDPLRVDPKLAQAAQEHSSDMADRDYFDHTTPEGLSFADRIVNAGYPTPGAENIAVGQKNAQQVMQGWMNSDGHRANILNCDLNAIGVGLEEDGMYWTQDFGY